MGDAQTQKQKPQGYFEFCIPREKQFTPYCFLRKPGFPSSSTLVVLATTYPPGNTGEWVTKTKHPAHCAVCKSSWELNKDVQPDTQQVENHLDNEK